MVTINTTALGMQGSAGASTTQMAAEIHASASKTTPVDADEMLLLDSASSFSLAKLTWANLKAALKTYFDALYASLASPAFTGVPTAPTAAPGTNTTQIATTAFVADATSSLSSYAPLASPALTGVPTAPTAAPGTSTTQIATTAFVANSASSFVATDIHAAASKTTPVDADELPLLDSASSFGLAKLTWANLKATLKTYFDTLYAAISGSATQTFNVASATSVSHAVRADQIQAQALTAFTTGGTSTAYTLTPTPALASYASGQRFRVKFHVTAGASPSMNVSGLGAVNLKLYNSTGSKVAASSTSIVANMLTDVEHDGTDFLILDPLPTTAGTTITNFTSSEQTISSAGQLILAHSLGAFPRTWNVTAICKTAELGYSVGDEMAIACGVAYTPNESNGGISCVVDATNFTIRFANNTNPITILRKDTGAYQNATNANWKLIVRASTW